VADGETRREHPSWLHARTAKEVRMDGISTNGADVDAALAEIAKVKETAEHMARDDSPPGADGFRVIAGLVHQLAEQLERIVAAGHQPPIPGDAGYPEDRHDRAVMLEEDRTPHAAPAEPVNDRAG
jgi:hypothetical protein